MVQAVEKLLHTSRFAHLIYSWRYGMEWDKVTNGDVGILQAILTQGLCQDPRILSVEGLVASHPQRNALWVSFTVNTIFGAQEVASHVSIPDF